MQKSQALKQFADMSPDDLTNLSAGEASRIVQDFVDGLAQNIQQDQDFFLVLPLDYS